MKNIFKSILLIGTFVSASAWATCDVSSLFPNLVKMNIVTQDSSQDIQLLNAYSQSNFEIGTVYYYEFVVANQSFEKSISLDDYMAPGQFRTQASFAPNKENLHCTGPNGSALWLGNVNGQDRILVCFPDQIDGIKVQQSQGPNAWTILSTRFQISN